MSQELEYLEVSREDWRRKAKERREQVRQLKRTIRDLTTSRDLWKEKYFALKRDLAKPSRPCVSRVAALEIVRVEEKKHK